MNRLGAILLFAVVPVFACSQSQTPPVDHVSKINKQAIDFKYVLQGEVHQLADLRGEPLILVLMRTSDIPSQVYMAQLKEASHIMEGKTAFLVLTIEPTESPFVELYADSEDLPFFIGVAEETVLTGHSQLGKIQVVPLTYFIDAAGKIKKSLPGIVDAEVIVKAFRQLGPG